MNLEICKKCMLEHNKEESIVVCNTDKEEPAVFCYCGRMVFSPFASNIYVFNGKNWNWKIRKFIFAKDIYHPTIIKRLKNFFNSKFDKIKELINDIIIKHKLNKFIKNNTIIPDGCFYKMEHELSDWNKK